MISSAPVYMVPPENIFKVLSSFTMRLLLEIKIQSFLTILSSKLKNSHVDYYIHIYRVYLARFHCYIYKKLVFEINFAIYLSELADFNDIFYPGSLSKCKN
jgi:hypothetical protein